MNTELKTYLLRQCRDWMTPDELEALDQLEQSDPHNAPQSRLRGIAIDYDLNSEKTEQLILLGRKRLETLIANRLLRDHKDILNYCPNCGKLARTPRARQCRHCEYRWFDSTRRSA